MVSRRIRWMTGCLLAVGLVVWTGASAAEPSSEELLKERGLSKSGLFYVLTDSESAFFEQLSAVEPYFTRLQEGRHNILALAENDSLIRVGDNRMSELNASITLLDHTIGRFGRKNTIQKQQLVADRAMLIQERATLRPQLDAAKAARVSPAQRRQMLTDFEKQRTEFLDKARYARPAAERLQSQYATLAKDKAVRDALKDVGRAAKTRIDLGPSPKFKTSWRDFQAAVNGAKTPDELMKDYANQQQAKDSGDAKSKRGKTR